jgi:simple sugar transport system permease protein
MPDVLHPTLHQALRSPAALLAAVILAMGLLFGSVAPDFWSLGNWVDLIEGTSVTAIMALGLLVVLVAGGIDISFAATASVAQYLAASAATAWGWPPAAALALGLLAGAGLGGFNALLIHRLQATSIIITISTMSLYFSLLMWATGGRSVYDLPAWWSDAIVWATVAGDPELDPVRLTLPPLVLAAVAIATAWLLQRSALGRQIHAFGGNPEAARRMGVPLGALQGFAYGFLGLMAALAGLLQAHRVGEAVPNAMVGGELFVLAAAVLGGASLTGGSGTVAGVLMGVLLLAVLRNGLNLMGVSPYFFQVLLGAVVLASAAATGLKRQRRRATLDDGATPPPADPSAPATGIADTLPAIGALPR